MTGRNSLFYYFLDTVNQELKDISLFKELVNKKRFNYKINFGKPIYPDDLGDNIEEKTKEIQNYVEYTLGKPPLIL